MFGNLLSIANEAHDANVILIVFYYHFVFFKLTNKNVRLRKMLVFHPNYPNSSHIFINSLKAPEGVFLPYQDIINWPSILFIKPMVSADFEVAL